MISIRNLSVSFDGQAEVVDNLNLDLEQGKITVIIGESGSGKSVTICALLGILPQEAQVQGQAIFGEIDLLSLSDKEMNLLRGKAIGYVPQSGGNSMHPLLTVGAQIAEPIIVHQKVKKRNAIQIAQEWLDKVGLKPVEKIAGAYPHTLSGGMKQRALIAMGMAGGAKILLVDEPTKGLDRERIEQVEELFKNLKGLTILCVTHDLRFAQNIADKICVMYGGESVEFADKDSFFSEPKHPYSQMLLASLPENGMECPENFTPPIEKKMGCLFYYRCPNRISTCADDIKTIAVGNHQVRCCQYVAT